MHLTRIEVRNLRNLTSVSIHPGSGLNIIEGANASGKTSFLESLHMLGLARSFRTLKSQHLVQHTHDSLTLFAEVENGGRHRIGIQRFSDNRSEYRLDSIRIESRSQLASVLPLQLITPESIELLTGSPSERRQFLDWLMFHVEHSFHTYWSHYQRFLKQRNALLRQGDLSTIEYWTDGLVENAFEIDRMRKTVLKRLIPYFEHYASILLPDLNLKCSYRQGWRKDIDFQEALGLARETDTKMKFTTMGPHRADIVLKDGDEKAVDVLSRGQLKLLLCALKLGQMALLKEETGMTAVVLMDDLPAELDTGHRKQLLSLLYDIGSQVFVTTTDRSLLDYSAWNDVKLFHVEHGQMKEVV